MIRKTCLAMAVAAMALSTAGCGTPQGYNAGNGALLGAGTGALVGGLATGRAGGALAGGAIGAATGALVGAAATPPPPLARLLSAPRRRGARVAASMPTAIPSASNSTAIEPSGRTPVRGRQRACRRRPGLAQPRAAAGAGGRPDCLVLHYTGMADGPSAIRWLCDPASGVSCHYVVEEDGHILQLVPEARRAWHAGRSVWAGEADMNSASIGIEIVNGGHSGACRPTRQPRSMPSSRCAATSCIATPSPPPASSPIPTSPPPARRIPASAFRGIGWPRRAWACGVATRAGSGGTLAPGEAGDAVATLQAALAGHGYGLAVTGIFDAETATVVRAFQRRYRPSRVDGVADADTRATLDALLNLRGDV